MSNTNAVSRFDTYFFVSVWTNGLSVNEYIYGVSHMEWYVYRVLT